MPLPTIDDIMAEIAEEEKGGKLLISRYDAVKKTWWTIFNALAKEEREAKNDRTGILYS